MCGCLCDRKTLMQSGQEDRLERDRITCVQEKLCCIQLTLCM